MRLLRTISIPVYMLLALDCAVAQDHSTNDESARLESTSITDPMAVFSRMIGGEWRMTVQSGHSMYEKWHWGPGQKSMRVMTDGLNAAGEPWHELEVYYWHPGHRRIDLLTMHPDVPGIGRGVGQGTIGFAGDTAHAVSQLWQRRGRRQMGLLWTFDGPDKYHEVLLETTDSDGLKPLAAWDHLRINDRAEPVQPVSEEAMRPTEHFKVFEPIVGQAWEANAEVSSGNKSVLRTTCEWIPYAEAIYLRTVAVRDGDNASHLLDTYIYHHVGLDSLRCLALSGWEGVYEGGVTAQPDGAMQFDLSGSESERSVRLVIHLDPMESGMMRQRVWTVVGVERTLEWEVLHQRVRSK